MRSALLDLLTACCIISAVALFAAGVLQEDKRWVIVAIGVGVVAVWLTESDSTL